MRLTLFNTAFFLFITLSGYATHIVGGEINYKYLDNTGPSGVPHRYEIEAILYIDRQSSFPNGEPDITLGIYNKNSLSFINAYTINKTSITTIDSFPFPFGCSIPGSYYLYAKVTYRGVINLPYISGGYIAQYLRCCRNSIITNLYNPQDIGMQLFTYMADSSLNNSNPKFTNDILYIACANDTVEIDFSGIDNEADSLVYSLAEPKEGGSIADPLPFPPSFFYTQQSVAYNSGYSYSQPFGSAALFNLNQNTGIINVSCNSPGVYLIGVKVEEFRNLNGTYTSIGFNYREIQVIVTGGCTTALPPCINFGTTSDTIIICDGVVEFEDRSLNNPTSWEWNFGDGTISNQKNPVHKYARPGSYNVTLKASNSYGTNQQTVANLAVVKSVNEPTSSPCNFQRLNTTLSTNIYGIELDSIYVDEPIDTIYQSFTCDTIITTIIDSTQTFITVTTDSLIPQNVAVWIDMDDDGQLESSEKVFESLNTIETHTGALQLPLTFSVYNKPLRMRVGTDSDALSSSCQDLQTGAYKDFSVRFASRYVNGVISKSITNTWVSISPNPSNGLFTIKHSETENTPEISVKDILGREVYKGNIASNAELNLTQLDRGIYTVIVKTEKQQIVKKIVIEK